MKHAIQRAHSVAQASPPRLQFSFVPQRPDTQETGSQWAVNEQL
jgi:hypothetical protein